MEFRSITIADAIGQLNKSIFLPAIQREFRWGPDRIEKLFDSLMLDFPIASFLFWKVDRNEAHENWTTYEFIRDFDQENSHNPEANLTGAGSDIELVLDGQQRLTSLYIGLKGSYRYFYYRWRKTTLYLNLLKVPESNDEDPEELTYQFEFRENDEPDDPDTELWYEVGSVLNFKDPEDAKAAIKPTIANFDEEKKDNAKRLVGRLHTRIHTFKFINFHEEKAQSHGSYDRVLNIFVRTNSGGMTLEYSDLLLSTATAKWEKLDARKEINAFTDGLNGIGAGYRFGNDFVLKGALYLTPPLPIQYMVKNFTRPNLIKIEDNWDGIRTYLELSVKLVSKFGFYSNNIVSQMALLPIAFYLIRRGNPKFDESSRRSDVEQQVVIRRWLVRVLLRGAFGSASDRGLKNVQDIITTEVKTPDCPFPEARMNAALNVNYAVSDDECNSYMNNGYGGKYTRLVLSLLYPDRDWKDAVFHEDHIFPKSEFEVRKLRKRGLGDEQIKRYVAKVNLIPNLELLTDTENLAKNAADFEGWLATRDRGFRRHHHIPELPNLGFEEFEEFFEARAALLRERLKAALA